VEDLLIDIPQAKDLIGRVLETFGSKYASESAIELILGTGIIESRWRYLSQVNGPARGFFQIEPDTAMDNCQNWLKFRPAEIDRCVYATLIPRRYWIKPNKQNWDYLLETNIAAGIIHARIKYWRSPEPLPDTISGYAAYWKKFYNTELGAGTVQKFIDQVSKYV